MKVGIDLGGSHIAIGVVNNQNKIIEKVEKRLVSSEKKNIKNNIENYIVENINIMKKKYKITKIGISVPGVVKNGCLVKAVNLGVENYKLKEILEKKLNIPITIRNDAKNSTIAESKIGCLKGIKRAVFLTLGTGIGGAIILNGEILDKERYPGLEIGHMIIQKDGKLCSCGKQGCFEAYASMKALKNNLRKEWGLTESTRGEELLAMMRKGKQTKAIEEFIQYLSIGISNLINIFEPEAIGIGGSFVYFQDVLLSKLKKYILENNLLFNKREELKILPAVLGNDAGIIGAVL